MTNHLELKLGTAVEVDWPDPTMEYVDAATGKTVKLYKLLVLMDISTDEEIYLHVPSGSTVWPRASSVIT